MISKRNFKVLERYSIFMLRNGWTDEYKRFNGFCYFKKIDDYYCGIRLKLVHGKAVFKFSYGTDTGNMSEPMIASLTTYNSVKKALNNIFDIKMVNELKIYFYNMQIENIFDSLE